MLEAQDKEQLLKEIVAMFEKKMAGQVKSKFDRFKDPESAEGGIEVEVEGEAEIPVEEEEVTEEAVFPGSEEDSALTAFKAKLEKKKLPVKAFAIKARK